MKKVKDCPDCGGMVGASASACPHCGAKLTQKTKTSTWVIGGLFAVAVFAVASGGSDNKPAKSDANLAPDTAMRLCAALKGSGATACEIDFKLNQANFIDATIPVSIAEAREACEGIVAMIKADNNGFSKAIKPWELRIFTPSSARPVASCRLN